MRIIVQAAALAIATLALTGCCSKAQRVRAPGSGTPGPIESVASSAEETKPLKAGDRIPAAELTDMAGRAVDLPGLVAAQPAVIIFYRGGWCPYCNTHLAALRTVEPRLVDLGYQVLALSADQPSEVRRTQEKSAFKYTLLSDSKMRAAGAFGIAFKVDDATIEKYKGYNIDLEAASGEAHHVLPVPSVFIVDTGGIIRFAYSNPDYKIRLAPEKVVEAAEQALR